MTPKPSGAADYAPLDESTLAAIRERRSHWLNRTICADIDALIAEIEHLNSGKTPFDMAVDWLVNTRCVASEPGMVDIFFAICEGEMTVDEAREQDR